jgi:hypothetical protein
MCQLAKHVHAKFRLSSFYPDGLRQKNYIFPRKIYNFSGKLLSGIQKNPNSNQVAIHVHAKFQLSGFFTDGLRHIFEFFFSKNLEISGNLQTNFKIVRNQVNRLIFQ